MKMHLSVRWWQRLRWSWIGLISAVGIIAAWKPEPGDPSGERETDPLPGHALLALPVSLYPVQAESVVAPWRSMDAQALQPSKAIPATEPGIAVDGPAGKAEAEGSTPDPQPQRHWKVRGRIEAGEEVRFCIEDTTTFERWWLRAGENKPRAGLMLERTGNGWQLRDLRAGCRYAMGNDLILRKVEPAAKEKEATDETSR